MICMVNEDEIRTGKYYVFSDNFFMETLTSQSLIAPINIDARRDFLLKNSQEFQIPIKGKYRGTEKQNIALLKFLQESPDFRKKWESELLAIKNTSEQKKAEIRQPIMEFGKAVKARE